MEYLIGVVLALLVCAFARIAGFDGDRVFYPTLLIVIATYNIKFAVMEIQTSLGHRVRGGGHVSRAGGGGVQEEPMVGYSRARRTRGFDVFHGQFIQNPGVPMWWPGFCLFFDILAGGFLAMLLTRRSGFAQLWSARRRRTSECFRIISLTGTLG
jgi:hypothetical protein